ncbi:beta-1,4-galactosyltransferase 4 [Girardinichthys multiradiatus]|uniref:beta-1,4-galactosyltransferase 4 n=1 Tax=Girardinichthys multiradiatus TaxID=208333 RepID=UPI001FACD63A|nr:beta-1,4-galactosyltransferase 4 [Girardinichthys multiradiatus]XP_047235951.1 beta-1,4-galactosyltransferase 4 [Girardinichthys multiradiatus]
MGLCTALKKVSRRGKIVVLVGLLLSVLAWKATISGETDTTVHVNSASTQTLVREEKLREKLNTWTVAPSYSNILAEKVDCPEESPLLVGASKLSFESSLNLKDVENENKGLTKGEYEPSDCKAMHSVAILIPHRNREKHLLYLLQNLHPFLQRQQLHYAIYVIHQAGDATFNRAKLLNVGYLEAIKDFSWECFIFHDVDLVPENDHNLYICDQQPKHLVVGRNVTGYKLRYKGYFGGVTAMTKDQFFQVNGFSNSYWGWGGEDDDLRVRVELQKMKILRPPADVARYTMVFHKRDSGNQVNRNRMNLLGQTTKMWRTDGLNSCKYETLSVARYPLYVNITVDIGRL